MQFVHMADLHLGKRLYEFPLIDDQRVMLESVISLCRTESPDLLLIAGDVFDKAIPSIEAIGLFESFLVGLSQAGIPVMIVAGNHDSGDRLSFGNTFFASHGIHVAGPFAGKLEKVVMADQHGPVTFHLMPFIRLADVRRFFPGSRLDTTADGVAAVLSTADRGPGRHVLVAHQFVTARGIAPLRSDSEVLQVGLADEIDASIFSGFDYVALGHLHGRQQVGPGPLHYAGSPLAYSFSEVNQTKGALIVDLLPGEEPLIRQIPLAKRHAMRRIRGAIGELLALGKALEEREDPSRFDYLEVTLTDQGAVADPMNRLKTVYPHVMRLLFDRDGSDEMRDALISEDDFRSMSLVQLFAEFVIAQTGHPLTDLQKQVVEQVAAKIESGAGAGR
ncbi:MAG TPA: exonuclease SbcCD subunit D [Bacillota bacterium]|jgi:exonuclease SbcD|nr:exonuclease SbcCD subunit D [Fastidiosipila sp.]HPX93610.1 exonuclease SbcCD subunit D [Bacillota bacterium]HQB81530.1 exonuclease SbcCD subunit D [Bacillota bacterium]